MDAFWGQNRLLLSLELTVFIFIVILIVRWVQGGSRSVLATRQFAGTVTGNPLSMRALTLGRLLLAAAGALSILATLLPTLEPSLSSASPGMGVLIFPIFVWPLLAAQTIVSLRWRFEKQVDPIGAWLLLIIIGSICIQFDVIAVSTFHPELSAWFPGRI